jgi:hypothetical protein
MQAYRSESDSASLWHIHIRTHTRIRTDFMDRRFMRDHRFTGIMGTAFLLREVPMCIVFTTFIMGNRSA